MGPRLIESFDEIYPQARPEHVHKRAWKAIKADESRLVGGLRRIGHDVGVEDVLQAVFASQALPLTETFSVESGGGMKSRTVIKTEGDIRELSKAAFGALVVDLILWLNDGFACQIESKTPWSVLYDANGEMCVGKAMKIVRDEKADDYRKSMQVLTKLLVDLSSRWRQVQIAHFMNGGKELRD